MGEWFREFRKMVGFVGKQEVLAVQKRAEICYEVMSGPVEMKELKRRVRRLVKKVEKERAEEKAKKAVVKAKAKKEGGGCEGMAGAAGRDTTHEALSRASNTFQLDAVVNEAPVKNGYGG